VQHRQAPLALETRRIDAVAGIFDVYEYQAVLPASGALDEVRAAAEIPEVAGYLGGVWLTPDAAPDFQVTADSLVRSTPVSRVSVDRGQARIVLDEPERVVIRVDAPQPSRLVLADSFYPGWLASVDGADTPISAADGAFRAVDVAAGAHEVVFAYRPRSLLIGGALSAVGVVLSIAIALAARAKKKLP
jgi:hypothetical protein